MTLAVNSGTLITYDPKYRSRWQSRKRRAQTAGDFRATADRLAAMFPGKVQTH